MAIIGKHHLKKLLAVCVLVATFFSPSVIFSDEKDMPKRSVRSEGISKEKLIRNLLKKRIQNDSSLNSPQVDVDSLPYLVLMGLPEATIVSIVETYWTMKSKEAFTDKEIFEAIEKHRSTLFKTGTMPSPLTLSSYIKYRLNLEHSHGVPISNKFIEEAIEEANKVFSPSGK